jgi:[ribosomal protein S18]-alanine N-acetyltransferase
VRFTVRDHRPEDFDTLWNIDQTCFAPGIAYSRYELKAFMRHPGAFTMVADAVLRAGKAPNGDPLSNEDSILGFLVAECGRSKIGDLKIGHIITLDVCSEARRHHVGSALLDAAEVRLLSAQCQRVRLEAAVDNATAISFYKRRGYNVIQTVPHYYSSGVDALMLEKDLLLPVVSD